MKIKAIAAICKKSKNISVIDTSDDGGEVIQWIGNGAVFYPITGLPYMEEDSIYTIFDITESQRPDYYFTSSPAPESICFDDTDSNEIRIEENGSLSINTMGTTLRPLRTRNGVAFIEERYLLPLGSAMDMLDFYDRVTSAGQSYIAVKAGFLLQAIMIPFNIINEGFVNQLKVLTQHCIHALSAKEEAEARRAAAEGHEQLSM